MAVWKVTTHQDRYIIKRGKAIYGLPVRKSVPCESKRIGNVNPRTFADKEEAQSVADRLNALNPPFEGLIPTDLVPSSTVSKGN
jgi:hypothetical protein